ncbi:HAD family hydrolase [Enterovibrio nigricans]|uniref:HAD-superfamily subfamily IB hydrolase, TIGR01490 n=1 Tax=Enterovibrio nigricans DSM 22720 TaxID=1121868 RepID=A0A1T4W5Z5_9GAMM|nr:HAD family hydrolase [Enterovibrio nigricans]PKF48658.1 HAD-IB family hydrolase [Enterovibrio nigricans]SKA72702.1 HAD-superfamily subfamily IB hydrolase, TIGR01490 [Enterovibrio nigricans DSM 22720]
MANLALFDFDGTITNDDCFTAFVLFATSKKRKCLGFALIWPVVMFHKLGLLPASLTRPVVAKAAFWRRSVKSVDAQAQQFVDEYISGVIRPEAESTLKWHKAQGDVIYLVSASLSPYLTIWCRQQGVHLLCSDLEKRDGRYTGRYVSGDCSKERKALKVKNSIDLSQYSSIYAYGDTKEDLALLALADHKYMCWKLID